MGDKTDELRTVSLRREKSHYIYNESHSHQSHCIMPHNILPHPASQPQRGALSAREQEVLHLIAYEYSSKEIAAALHLSEQTIISHRKNIMIKLGVKNVAGMMRVAFGTGILSIRQYQL